VEEIKRNKIEKTFDNLIDIRFKARIDKDQETLNNTEEEFKEATEAYIKHVYKINTVKKRNKIDLAELERSIKRIK